MSKEKADRQLRDLRKAEVIAKQYGLEVRLQGLKMKPEINAQEGVLLKFDEAKGRWQAKLNSGKVLEVKPENLQAKNS